VTSPAIVQKLWNYCNVLRDDGMSYGDYVEQLTYLLFLKMADERTKPPYSEPSAVPLEYSWPSLVKNDGDELFDHYRHVLEKLGNEKGLLGLIFNKSQNKFQDPAKLRRLIVDLIDKENWSVMSADVKGDAYEGLLEKNAQDVKTGAGQYATSFDCGDCRCDSAEAWRNDLRSSVRYRRLFSRGERIHHPALSEHDEG
jgi:type I restriction enzyme M protein